MSEYSNLLKPVKMPKNKVGKGKFGSFYNMSPKGGIPEVNLKLFNHDLNVQGSGIGTASGGESVAGMGESLNENSTSSDALISLMNEKSKGLLDNIGDVECDIKETGDGYLQVKMELPKELDKKQIAKFGKAVKGIGMWIGKKKGIADNPWVLEFGWFAN